MILREAHKGEYVGFGLVHQRGELWHFRTQLIGDLAPLGAGSLGILLNEGGADESCNHPAAIATSMSENFAHEVDPTALPRGMQHFGDRGLDALVGI